MPTIQESLRSVDAVRAISGFIFPGLALQQYRLGDDYVELVSANADIRGNRKSFDYGYGPEYVTTLAAEDYLIMSLDKQTPITIKGGERSEVTIRAGKSK